MKDLYTIIYYTSNREKENFERKIQDNIIKNCGDIPIISVSQKPIDFGRNICVGNVGFSDHNGMRQMLIGAREAKTTYIISCESDFLYPPDYFKFIPSDKNECYRYDNVWIAYKWESRGGFRFKRYSEGAQVCGRKLLIEKYEKRLDGLPEWIDGKPDDARKAPFQKYKWKWFGSDIPCISFKTGDGVRNLTWVTDTVPSQDNLPYWGNIDELRKNYL
jgi:hypothetical protein